MKDQKTKTRSDYEAQTAYLAALAEDDPANFSPAIDGDLRPAPGRRNKEIDDGGLGDD